MSDFSKGIARELIFGDFNNGESTWAGTAGNIAIGFIPIVGQLADLRDTAAALNDVKNNYKDGAAWVGLGLSVLAWIPLLDGLKSMKKGAKKMAWKGKKMAKKGMREVSRTFLEDRKTFNASKDFFKRYKWLFGKKHGWSSEHSIIKQRFYRSQSKDPKQWHPIMRAFPPGTKVNTILRMAGDAGWNQVPIPMKLNKWLDNHRLISFFFNIGSYAAALGFIYGSLQFGKMLESELDQMIFGKRITIDGTNYGKKITLD